jgi:hypothetical protein
MRGKRLLDKNAVGGAEALRIEEVMRPVFQPSFDLVVKIDSLEHCL